jgi:hypothetical protein
MILKEMNIFNDCTASKNVDLLERLTIRNCVRFEVFMEVTMKNTILWDAMPFGSCKNQCFRGT